MINEITPGMALKYNKHYIGLARDGLPDNFILFRARKEHLIGEFRIERSEEVAALLNDSGIELLEHRKRGGRYRMRVTANDLITHRDLLLDLIRRASGTPPPADD